MAGPINIGYIQWFSLAKPTVEVARATRNRSLVPPNNKCGRAITHAYTTSILNPIKLSRIVETNKQNLTHYDRRT